MSDIFVLNFDGLSTPSIELKFPQTQHGTQSIGWGLAWYPTDDKAAIVVKDPVARNSDALKEAVTDWENFSSTVFFCKVKGTRSDYSHNETQPFSRSFAGRDWIFIHNGDLDKIALSELIANKSRFLEPLGRTNSEMAFCYLLGQIQAHNARTLADVPGETLCDWFHRLDNLGNADICLSDGLSVICYHGVNSKKTIYYNRLQPPERQVKFDAEAMLIQLNDPRDTYRTALFFSSIPFGPEQWHFMQSGQLIIARRGAIVWSNQPQPNLKQTVCADQSMMTEPAQIPKTFIPIQAEQAQQMHQSIVNIRSITQTREGKPLSFRFFNITHTTEYHYTEPVEHSTHLFRLQPVEDPTQEVVNANFIISADGEEMHYEDVFGNQSLHYSINTPYTNLFIQFVSRVKVYALPPDDYRPSERQSTIPLVWMPWQQQMMMPYLLPTELPESQLAELTTYAMSFVERNNYHLLDTLKDMNLSIYRDYQYKQGTTSINTTPFEVYTAREGVCQDFANLLICLARFLNIPARYRMGYIYTGANYENKIQSDASHAWVEVYLPYLGWRGFDPTNGCMVGQDHIRIACGRNYRDATPTSGTIFKGGGTETLKVDVKIEEVS